MRALILELKENRGTTGKVESFYIAPNGRSISQIFRSDERGRVEAYYLNKKYFEIMETGYDISYVTIENFNFDKFDKTKQKMLFIVKNYDRLTQEKREKIDFTTTTFLKKDFQ
jgi:predicted nucleotide-binding protein (sugar kinase/HSP70/actin superfamily)